MVAIVMKKIMATVDIVAVETVKTKIIPTLAV
jgi:hypothetical protein